MVFLVIFDYEVLWYIVLQRDDRKQVTGDKQVRSGLVEYMLVARPYSIYAHQRPLQILGSPPRFHSCNRLVLHMPHKSNASYIAVQGSGMESSRVERDED